MTVWQHDQIFRLKRHRFDGVHEKAAALQRKKQEILTKH
jgi:hypothetical protein